MGYRKKQNYVWGTEEQLRCGVQKKTYVGPYRRKKNIRVGYSAGYRRKRTCAVQKKEKRTCGVQCRVQNKTKPKKTKKTYVWGTVGGTKENVCVRYRRKKNLRVGYSAGYRTTTTNLRVGYRRKKNLRVGYSAGYRRKLTCGYRRTKNNLCVGYRRKKNLCVEYSAQYRKRKRKNACGVQKKEKFTCGVQCGVQKKTYVWPGIQTEERKTYVWVQKKEKLTCGVQCGVQKKEEKNLSVGYRRKMYGGWGTVRGTEGKKNNVRVCYRKRKTYVWVTEENNLRVDYRRKNNLQWGTEEKTTYVWSTEEKTTYVWSTEEKTTYVWGTDEDGVQKQKNKKQKTYVWGTDEDGVQKQKNKKQKTYVWGTDEDGVQKQNKKQKTYVWGTDEDGVQKQKNKNKTYVWGTDEDGVQKQTNKQNKTYVWGTDEDGVQKKEKKKKKKKLTCGVPMKKQRAVSRLPGWLRLPLCCCRCHRPATCTMHRKSPPSYSLRLASFAESSAVPLNPTAVAWTPECSCRFLHLFIKQQSRLSLLRKVQTHKRLKRTPT